MEVMLLWLDDLDDLVCALAQIVERSRLPSLKVAFVAALSLAAAQLTASPEFWEPVLGSVSVGGLVLWAIGSWLVARHALPLIASGARPRVNA